MDESTAARLRCRDTTQTPSRANTRESKIALLHTATLVLAAFAVPSASGGDAASDGRTSRGAVHKRFSFGVMAGTSLAPARTRSTTYGPTPGVLAEFDQGPGLPPLLVTTTVIEHVRHGANSPLAGAFAEMLLGSGFSVQASLSYRLLPTTVVTENNFGEPAEQRSFTTRQEYRWGILEVPSIVIYRFGTAKWRPFVGFGPLFRVKGERWYESRYGAVAAFGFDLFQSRRWAFTPQIRYTRWGRSEHPWSAPRSRVQALVAVVF